MTDKQQRSLWVGAVSLFPEMFTAISEYGITGRAVRNGLLRLSYWNPRDFSDDPHRRVDDRPYGGGPGMLMRVQPLFAAIQAARVAAPSAKVLYLSPSGKRLDHPSVLKLAESDALLLVCGRYEGIDARLLASEIDEEWSVGDYVVSGGELPAMLLIDALVRFIPAALGSVDSAADDSFSGGLLESPQYTRPEVFNDMMVPEILLSGHHEKISQWRMKQALGRTWSRRPDLLKKLALTDEQKALLAAFQKEYKAADGNR